MDAILSRNEDYFKNEGRVLQIETCLQNLRKITMSYSQLNANDGVLDQELRRCEDQWELTAQRVEGLRQQLQQIPAKWDSYHQKFEQMEFWMDHVDETMGNIVKEVNSAEEFEKQKAVFQVCLTFKSFNYQIILFILILVTQVLRFYSVGIIFL